MVAAEGPLAPLGGEGVGAEGNAMLLKEKPSAIPARGGAAFVWGGETECGAGGGEGSARGLLPWPPSLRRRGECRKGRGAGGLPGERAAGCERQCLLSVVPRERLARWEGKGCAAPELETSGLLRVSCGGSLPAGGGGGWCCVAGSGQDGSARSSSGREGDSAFVQNTAALPGVNSVPGAGGDVVVPEGSRDRVARSQAGRR